MIRLHVQLASNDNVYELHNYIFFTMPGLSEILHIATLSSRLEKWWSHSFTKILCEYSLVTTMLHYLCLHRHWCDANSRMCLLTCTWSSTLPQCSSPQHRVVPVSVFVSVIQRHCHIYVTKYYYIVIITPRYHIWTSILDGSSCKFHATDHSCYTWCLSVKNFTYLFLTVMLDYIFCHGLST